MPNLANKCKAKAEKKKAKVKSLTNNPWVQIIGWFKYQYVLCGIRRAASKGKNSYNVSSDVYRDYSLLLDEFLDFKPYLIRKLTAQGFTCDDHKFVYNLVVSW